MAEISLCMIVKDEEAVLGRCLDSIKDAVDEIIIVDTGSSDSTKEIAARYTNRIYDFEWIDDFSAARNYSFSKANMDFVMWLDADDVIEDKDRAALIEFKNNIPDTADVIMMRYNTAFDEEGNPVFSYYRARLIRRSIQFSWQGRVHEAIVHSGRTLYKEIAVTHRSVKKVYTDRNLKIYEKQKSDGIPFSPRDQFYYGRELYYHKRYEEALTVLEEFLNSGEGWTENNIEACKIMSYCYTQKNEIQKALDALTVSFRYDSPRAEICCELGNLFMKKNNYRIAAFWFETALRIPKNETGGGFVSQDCYGYLPCIQLCVCYDRLGDRKKSEAYNQIAGKYRPSSPAYLHNLEYFKSVSSNIL